MKLNGWSLLGWMFVSAMGLLTACNRDKPSEPAPSAPPTTVAAPRPGEATSVRYVERMLGGAEKSDRVPMIVAIHGLGDRPESFGRIFDGSTIRARLILPYGLSSYGDGFSWFPLSNFEPKALADGTSHAAHELAKLLGELEKSRPIQGKPIVTGFSQGGMLSFTLAVLHPDVISEALPLAGLLAPPLYPASWPMGKLTPLVRAFHGDADDRVPIAGARDSVRALVGVGFMATLSEYPNIRHSVSSDMRRDWLAALDAAAKRASQP